MKRTRIGNDMVVIRDYSRRETAKDILTFVTLLSAMLAILAATSAVIA
jgi:hypothetical protein